MPEAGTTCWDGGFSKSGGLQHLEDTSIIDIYIYIFFYIVYVNSLSYFL